MRSGFARKPIVSFKDVNPRDGKEKKKKNTTHLFEDGLYSLNSPFALCPSPLVRDKHEGIFLFKRHFFWRMTKLLELK